MTNDLRDDFEDAVKHKRAGGVALEAHVSKAVWMGGSADAWAHEPFVAVGPKGWESESELTFFASRARVETFIAELRAAADEARPK